MINQKQLAAWWTSVGTFGLVLAFCFAWPISAVAQAPPSGSGESAIYESATAPVNSQAFVDASVFYPAQGDICAVINYILTNTSEFQCGGVNNPRGVIIDARGINPPVGSALQCASQPFAPNCGSTHSPIDGSQLSSTILLPAATIEIQHPWTIPANTKVLGEGKNSTTLQACKANANGCTVTFSGSDMIDMGTSPCGIDCQAEGLEHLTLDGNSEGVNGIVNNGNANSIASEELSYVNDVALMNIGGTGLWVQGGNLSAGNNSGPYSNIYFNGTGTCAKINGARSTRGIHGLTCITPTSAPLIYIDGSNNSIEDVTLIYMPTNGPPGTTLDGILIGSQATAQSNVLVNITGSNLVNLVHVSNQTSTQSNCPPQNANNSASVNNVCDLAVLGISSGSSTATIKDDLTNSTLSDSSVGMYLIGEQVFNNGTNTGYSRFSTSPSLPAWLIGGISPSNPCSTGSLFSNTSGPQNSTLSTCVAGVWKSVK